MSYKVITVRLRAVIVDIKSVRNNNTQKSMKLKAEWQITDTGAFAIKALHW